LKACLQPLDASKPRYISGLGSPDEVLWCAANGIDLIESTYPAQAAALGIALTFEVRYQELMSWQGNEAADNKEQAEMDERGARGGKLNLWDTGKIN
jgi:tRNA-guanine family transglycosylase